jgi:hypothetical protein
VAVTAFFLAEATFFAAGFVAFFFVAMRSFRRRPGESPVPDSPAREAPDNSRGLPRFRSPLRRSQPSSDTGHRELGRNPRHLEPFQA